MKTRHWILLLAGLFLLSVAAAALLYFYQPQAKYVTVISDGRTVAVLDLSEDAELTVPYRDGSNTVTVKGGKISVTEASCPDGYCMQAGEKDGGLPIICLPNHLVLRFSEQGPLDGMSR